MTEEKKNLTNMKIEKDFWKNREIFPTITTTIDSDWRGKIKEADKLGLIEVCVFLTGLKEKERQEFYRLLEKTKIKRVSLVHIRTDMEPKEIEFFRKTYKTRTFNYHSPRQFGPLPRLEKYRKEIFIENTRHFKPGDEQDFAGVCIDFSHLEGARLMTPQIYKRWIKVFERARVGCNHISAIKKEPETDPYGHTSYDSHLSKDFTEFDYLKKYPAAYFSPVMALELENSLTEQLKIIEYVKNLLKDKK